MTSQHSAVAVDPRLSGDVSAADNQLRVTDSIEFQFFPASQCSALMLREISEFLDTQETSHPYQFPQWSGNKAHLAFLRCNSQLRWFAQCGVFYPAGRVFRPIRALSVNRGPICDHIELMETGLRKLAEMSRRKSFAFVDIAPEWAGGFAEAAEPMLVRNGWRELPGMRSSLRLDLSPNCDQLLASFRKATRYEIRRSAREQVEVTMAQTETDFEDWLRLYLRVAAGKHFAAEDPEHIRRVLRWLAYEKDRGGLMIAHKDGRLLGGIVIVRAGARCWYLLGATSKDQRFSVGHLLQWRAIQWAKEHGCRQYDFTGGEYHDGMDSGTAFFKRGFSDQLIYFLPPHRLATSERRLRACDLIAKVHAGMRSS